MGFLLSSLWIPIIECLAGKSRKSIEVEVAGKRAQLNGGFSSKPQLITGGYCL